MYDVRLYEGFKQWQERKDKILRIKGKDKRIKRTKAVYLTSSHQQMTSIIERFEETVPRVPGIFATRTKL